MTAFLDCRCVLKIVCDKDCVQSFYKINSNNESVSCCRARLLVARASGFFWSSVFVYFEYVKRVAQASAIFEVMHVACPDERRDILDKVYHSICDSHRGDETLAFIDHRTNART